MASGRDSIGYEIDPTLNETIQSIPKFIIDYANAYIQNRIERHIFFSAKWIKENGPMKYTNKHYGFPVMTTQEKELILNGLVDIKKTNNDIFEVLYSDKPQSIFCKDWETEIPKIEINSDLLCNSAKKHNKASSRGKRANSFQLGLFHNSK
jgi:hypothetical protein